MATKQELLEEAYKRGLLPPEKAALYEEAVKRGVIKDDGFSFSEMVGNIPSSARKLGEDIWSAVSSPKQTLTAIGGLIESGVEHLNPFMDEEDMKYGQYGKAFSEGVKSRYGSKEAALKTIETDPVGFVTDLSGAVNIAGTGIKAIPGAAKYGNYVRQAGAAIDPINIAANATIAGVKAITPKGLPARLYESAAKFGTTIPADKRAKMTQTALREKIMPTTAGVGKLDTIADALNTSIESLITEATNKGAKVPVGAVFRNLKQVRNQMGGFKIGAKQDLAKIDKMVSDLHKYAKEKGVTHLTAKELQDFKTDAYKKIDFNRTQMKASLAKEEASKAMSRAAKESLEKISPDLKNLNMRLGELLELRPAVARSANRIDNLNINSINTPLNIGAGAAVGGEIGAAAGTIAAILEMPRIKAKGAIWLNRVKQMPIKAIMASGDPDIALIRNALIQAGRLEERSPVAR